MEREQAVPSLREICRTRAHGSPSTRALQSHSVKARNPVCLHMFIARKYGNAIDMRLIIKSSPLLIAVPASYVGDLVNPLFDPLLSDAIPAKGLQDVLVARTPGR